MSAFVEDVGFFAGGMRFGATLWEYYAEFYKCMQLDEVLVLTFDAITRDLPRHLPLLADFLCPGWRPSKPVVEEVCFLAGKERMIAHSAKFDESWAFEELGRVGRMDLDSRDSFRPAPRVTAGHSDRLNARAEMFLAEQWQVGVAGETGLQTYEAMEEAVALELDRRLAQLANTAEAWDI